MPDHNLPAPGETGESVQIKPFTGSSAWKGERGLGNPRCAPAGRRPVPSGEVGILLPAPNSLGSAVACGSRATDRRTDGRLDSRPVPPARAAQVGPSHPANGAMLAALWTSAADFPLPGPRSLLGSCPVIRHRSRDGLVSHPREINCRVPTTPPPAEPPNPHQVPGAQHGFSPRSLSLFLSHLLIGMSCPVCFIPFYP